MSLYGLRPLIQSIMSSGSTAYVPWGHITGTLSAQTDLAAALAGKVPTTRTLTINGTSFDLAANRSWSVGTVTGSSAAANRIAYWTSTSAIGALSALTQGSVLFADSNGLPTENNSKLFWYNTGQQFIIGSNTVITHSGNYSSLYVGASTPADGTLGLVSLGGGTFGASGTFAGGSSGTVIAINTTGSANCLDFQNNGTKRSQISSAGALLIADTTNNSAVWAKYQGAGGYIFNGTNTGQDVLTAQVSGTIKAYLASGGQLILGAAVSGNLNGFINIPVAPTGNANYGLACFGASGFSGGGGTNFAGSSSGTVLAVNIASGPDFANWQIAGVSYFLSNSSALTLQTDLKLGTVGNKIFIKETGNASSGGGTLSGGAATINTTKVTTNSRIHITGKGGNAANVACIREDKSARVNNTSFKVVSDNASDTQDFDWLIIEPA